jgi:DNA-binding transcriptional LysR family regulator
MHFDLVDLRLLVLVVDTGGIAAAARQANISVSALSERMKSLEQSAGVVLLQRSARGSKPTQAGLELAVHARAVLLQAERLSGAVAAWKQRDRGLIRLQANSNAIASFLPDVLASFLARHPDVLVDLREETSDEIARAVRAGDVDLGIAAGNANLEGLDTRPFRSDQLVLLVPPGHAFSGRRAVSFAETLDESFIGLDIHSAIHVFLSNHAHRLGRELTTRIRLRSFDGVCRMVAAGAGVAVMPGTAVSGSAFDAGAMAIAISDAWAQRDLVICLPIDRPPSRLVQRLVSEITEGTGGRFEQIGRRGRG